MENISTEQVKQEGLRPKTDLSRLQSRLKDFTVKFKSFMLDPKKRLVVVVGVVFIAIFLLLIVGIIYKSISQPKIKDVPKPTVISTPTPAQVGTIEDRLGDLRDKLTDSFEEKPLLVPEVDFKVEFKLE